MCAGDRYPVPGTVTEALGATNFLEWPTEVVTERDGKYWRIAKARFAAVRIAGAAE